MGYLALQQICSIILTIQKSILDSPFTWFSFLSSIVSGAFILGRYLMAAKKNMELAEKDKEMANIIHENTSKVNELERQHRVELRNLIKELKDTENESASWKEKYFQLLMDRTQDRTQDNNSS